MKNLCILFILLFVSLHSQKVDKCKIESSEHWKELFKQNEGVITDSTSYLGQANAWSMEQTSNNKCFLGYYIDQYATMYDATGDTKYVDRAISLIQNVMASSRIICQIQEEISTTT